MDTEIITIEPGLKYTLNIRFEEDYPWLFEFFEEVEDLFLVGWHRRYNIGASQTFKDPKSLEDYIKANGGWKRWLVLPLYMIDHSGLAFSMSPFSCPWDSGQVGVVCLNRNAPHFKCRKRDKLIKIMSDFVRAYSALHEGQVFYYNLDTEDGEEVSSCGGYYGPNNKEVLEEIRSEALAEAKHHAARQAFQYGLDLKGGEMKCAV